MIRLLPAAALIMIGVVHASADFSPLSTFYDIDVSTTATYFAGRSFGPGCGRGGSIPDGFIAVAMNGATTGLANPAGVCGMCVAIKGPAPSSPNPADNVGIVGEYFGFVYEVCPDCTQAAGLQLGIPGAGQNSVVWRAIPCPAANGTASAASDAPSATAASGPFLFFEETRADRARFQVRGLSAPIVRAAVAGRALNADGPFYVLDGTGMPVFPFTVDVSTALGEQLSIQVPAYREYGALLDLITVRRQAPPRAVSVTAPDAQSRFGSGEITTLSGAQTRTVRTATQAGRQVVTITTGPSGAQQQPQQASHGRPGLYDHGRLPDPAEFLGQPLGLDDFGPRYEQVRVPAGGAGAGPNGPRPLYS